MNRTEQIFKALASPVRREILELLREGELPTGDIAAHFEITAPSVSRHLALLRGAGLISERRDGSRIFYSLEAEELAHSVSGFLSAVCPTQVLDRVRRARGDRSATTSNDDRPSD